MTVAAAVITTAQEVAATAAADIRTHGHYQGGIRGETMTTACCLLANNAYGIATSTAWRDYLRALSERTGVPVGDGGYAYWNDTHTTDEVLAVLDDIATS